MRWDVFCRVVDNFGDIGVCWRLAADLAARGNTVRLWVDDPSALAWMAPDGAAGVTVIAWTDAIDLPAYGLGDVVIEAFGCELPTVIQRALAARARAGTAAVWINLEYLSAEPFTARAHGLPSPQLAGPAAGLTKWFFYPGFDERAGGLLRERDLAARQAAFDAPAWLATHGITHRDGERLVSLFCYPSAPVAALIDALHADAAPTVILATAGAASALVRAALGSALEQGNVRAVTLPYLTQRDFDHLLWCADLNVVRGEDSLVRALWAGRPFLWHIYPQADDAHLRKLAAFDRLVIDAARAAAADEQGADEHGANGKVGAMYARASLRWNAPDAGPANAPLALPDLTGWRAACERLRTQLLAQDDLATRLSEFIRQRRPG